MGGQMCGVAGEWHRGKEPANEIIEIQKTHQAKTHCLRQIGAIGHRQ